MCGYSYSWYICNHDYFIHDDTVEVCEHRFLSGYSADAWTIDMCKRVKAVCKGFAMRYCHECSEDHTLEFELDE